MTKFKIENFCSDHNLEFKKYYNFLNNPFYLNIFLTSLKYIEHDKIKKSILKMIIENHKYVLDKLNKINIIISFYKQNNLINKSEIGKFFVFYEECINNIDLNNYDDLLKLFYKLILYKNCISVLKECFYIFSDYRACIYFLTPSIDFNNTKKSTIDKVINNFKDNLNTLNQIISKIYLGDSNPWISPYYSSSYAMFETLLIIKKYYKDPYKPIEKLDIKFNIKKKCAENKVLINLCNNYKIHKLSDLDISVKDINNVSSFLIKLKKLGYDMWFTIPLIFDTIFEKYELIIQESNVFASDRIYYQKLNNRIGLMCYILVIENYITNVNIFQNFNI
jgi:hypothetical protein